MQLAGIGGPVSTILKFLGRLLLGAGRAARGSFTGAFRSAYYLTKHFTEHGAKLGYATEGEYLAGAQKFIADVLDAAGGKGELVSGTWNYFVSKEGSYFFFNKATSEFAIVDQSGTILSYYKAAGGWEYWLGQIATYK